MPFTPEMMPRSLECHIGQEYLCLHEGFGYQTVYQHYLQWELWVMQYQFFPEGLENKFISQTSGRARDGRMWSSPSKNSGHQGLNELPWLIILFCFITHQNRKVSHPWLLRERLVEVLRFLDSDSVFYFPWLIFFSIIGV